MIAQYIRFAIGGGFIFIAGFLAGIQAIKSKRKFALYLIEKIT